MPKLDSAILTLNSIATRPQDNIAPVSRLLVTALYLLAVLSVPLQSPQILMWLAVYPVFLAEMTGQGFGRVFVKSLWVVPLLMLIGIFNPVYDTAAAFHIGNVTVSRGWVSLVSLMLRGLLCMQALLLLTGQVGVYGFCDALAKCRCPRILVTQLLFTYRYMLVVLQEAQSMDNARKSRGFGRRSYPIGLWGRMIGQLLVRSYERAMRIHRAMLSRGFDGVMPASSPETASPARNSVLYVIIWALVIAALRFVPLSQLVASVASNHLK